jgi:hypothetical protein
MRAKINIGGTSRINVPLAKAVLAVDLAAEALV